MGLVQVDIIFATVIQKINMNTYSHAKSKSIATEKSLKDTSK